MAPHRGKVCVQKILKLDARNASIAACRIETSLCAGPLMRPIVLKWLSHSTVKYRNLLNICEQKNDSEVLRRMKEEHILRRMLDVDILEKRRRGAAKPKMERCV